MALHGHCGPTVDGERGDCDIGDRGWIGLRQGPATSSWDGAIDACRAACLACDRCRFISLSLKYKDCSWYRRCPKLHERPDGFRTLRVRNGTVARQQRRRRNRRGGADEPPPRAARDALQWFLPGAAPWGMTRAATRVALCFFGKVGTLRDPSSYTAADSGDEATVRLAHASLQRAVVAANPRIQLSTFVHSWNPTLGHLIDSLYVPAWSAHEAQEHDERVPSAALSMQRVLRAKAAHEAARGFEFDLVAMLRHDLIFFSPLSFGSLERAQVWMPMQCCGADPEGVGDDAYTEAYETVRQTCYSETGTVSELCRVRNMLRSVPGSKHQRIADEANANYWVNDWLLIAPSRTADSFGSIYERLTAYRAALAEVGISTEWMHFMWALHIHHAMHAAAGVRAIPGMRAAADFTIVRLANAERLCTTNVSVQRYLPERAAETRWGGMADRLCPMRGEVACKWQSLRCSVDTPSNARLASGRGTAWRGLPMFGRLIGRHEQEL